MATTDQIIAKYLGFSGTRSNNDFLDFYKEIVVAKAKATKGSRDYIFLEYVQKKIEHGINLTLQYGNIYAIVDEQSKDDIEEILKKQGYLSGVKVIKPKKKQQPKKKKRKGLGKVVDDGKVSPRGNSDIYWRNKGIDQVFKPDDSKVRVGNKIEASYRYTDMRFLENYYGLRAFEFGNWLSQQDRINYLAGLGLAMYDLQHLLGFPPEKMSIKHKLAIAFGARGRGGALAHFEPGSFTINLTRYRRPPMLENRSESFRRANLTLYNGGVGAFAHEYGHALDYFGGLHVERGDTFSLSGDDSTDIRPRKEFIKKASLKGLMERLLFKICWKTNGSKHSDYYTRLTKATKKKYYRQRNEIFARAFEVYVQYKLFKKKHKNIFLNKTKYNTNLYLTIQEMKKLEPEFDALMKGLKRYL